MTGTQRIAPMSATGDFEDQYRRQRLPHDVRVAGIVIGAAQLSHVLLLNDWALFGPTPTFWSLLAVRAGFGLLSGMAWMHLSRNPAAGKFDLTLLVWCLALGALTSFVATTRPPGVGITTMLGVLIVTIFYTFVPLPLRWQMVAAIALSTASILYATRVAPAAGEIPLRTLVIILVIVNVVGIGASRDVQAWRRLSFGGLLAERNLRADLEKALSEVRTLRGLLPICSHCKKIRNESGDWEKVEAYIRQRSDASFSHGICPECMQNHYGDLGPAPF